MTHERRQLTLATLAMVAVFAIYETAKTVLFPALGLNTSHVISTIVVGVMTALTAHYVLRHQRQLLDEREQGNARLRAALTQTERTSTLLAAILASVAEGLVITDRAANVLLVNDAARALLALGARPLPRLTDVTRDQQAQRAFADVIATGQRAEARLELWTSNGSAPVKRILHLHAAPLRFAAEAPEAANATDGVVCVFIDITKLEQLERVRQEFLSNVSHELRTPLTSISAYTEMLLDDGLADAAHLQRFLTTIQRNTERMRNLVGDIAELSAIESGAAPLEIAQVALRPLVEEVFNGLTPRSQTHRVTLHNEVGALCYVNADRRRLEQILTNLIDNATKFNRPDGQVVVTADAGSSAADCAITVRDTGYGIDAEHLPRVFERFYRVDKARSRALGGTGLGLAIVKHLALAHGGEASVTSEVGIGSAFTIKLPQRQPA